jgi:uncharacterized protein YukJ
MPIQNYSVLKGRPQHGQVVFDHNGKNPHYRIFMTTDAGNMQADVNIESSDGSQVLYLILEPFTPPNTGALGALSTGLTALNNISGTLALDYVREKIGNLPMVDRINMTKLPIPTTRPQDQLKNAVITLLNKGVADKNGLFYAFGSAFGDPNGTTGIHDIHMNQGNPAGSFEADNGVWQDGALFLNLPSTKQWTALFIAFQTQSWKTDNHGNPLAAKTLAQSR